MVRLVSDHQIRRGIRHTDVSRPPFILSISMSLSIHAAQDVYRDKAINQLLSYSIALSRGLRRVFLQFVYVDCGESQILRSPRTCQAPLRCAVHPGSLRVINFYVAETNNFEHIRSSRASRSRSIMGIGASSTGDLVGDHIVRSGSLALEYE